MNHSPESRPRSAIANASWNAFSTVWGIVISFVLAPVLIHNLGTAQYGILLLVWSFTGILGLAGFGFGEATLRYMAHYFGRDDLVGVNRVLGATLTFYLAVCVVLCGGVFAAAQLIVGLFNVPPGDHELFGWLLRLSAVSFAVRAVSLTYGAVPMALHRYDISSKIGVTQNVVRSAGFIVLALARFGILHLVLWDIITQAITLWVQGVVIRRIAPGVRLLPGLSFRGLREIVGFSVFSFLTYLFHMMQREAGKLILGSQLGPAPVAYLGTPDNVAQRIHMVVASGSETLMPRFSATHDRTATRSLLRQGTWSSLAVSLILLLPLAVLLPDFLELWISPEFSRESADLGRLVALSYISQGAYAPVATFFRGTGKPWLVTLVILTAGLTTLGASMVLIAHYGAIGVGYAYAAGSLPALAGLVHGWFYLFGRGSAGGLLRCAGLPLLLAGVAMPLQFLVRDLFGPLGWIELLVLGGLFAALTGALIFGADLGLGGAEAPSRQFLEKFRKSEKVVFAFRFLALRKSR